MDGNGWGSGKAAQLFGVLAALERGGGSRRPPPPRRRSVGLNGDSSTGFATNRRFTPALVCLHACLLSFLSLHRRVIKRSILVVIGSRSSAIFYLLRSCITFF